MKNLEKRRRIMKRSIRLGHCICDPNLTCPCDLLKEKDVCLCAGERMEAPSGPVRLTQLVEKAGCASKIDQASLKAVLNGLPPVDDPRVLVGVAAGDDAGVYKLDNGVALVQTVDVFSPSVDDPYTFGQVAAANSLSDVYAMGGRPVCALSVIGFPIGTVPDRVMEEILRGGIDKMNEAGVPVIGGHSIKDEEIKAGFAVTGVIDPDRMVTNDGARSGDVLILTKPIGVGIIAFAAQIDRAPAGSVEAAARSMTTLNKSAAELMLEFDARACTDVTGFGLIGHLAAMAAASRVDVEIVFDDVPLFPGVTECVAEDIIPGGVERNRESSADAVTMGAGTAPAMLDICLDPQTSGGLLIAVAPEKAGDLLDALHDVELTEAAIIGKVTGKGSGRILLSSAGERRISSPKAAESAPRVEEAPAEPKQDAEETIEELECCSPEEQINAPAASGSGVEGIRDSFKAFMAAAGRPGALDVATKKSLEIALSVITKCEPCLKLHAAKARKMGFSQEEIDEAAWMAIAFGGAPTMMFYNTVMKNMDGK